MLAETDDEIYRVHSVWLGPPNATLPFHARYVAWGIGVAVFLALFSVARLVLELELSFFLFAWVAVITIAATKGITKMINYEKPLGSVLALFGVELLGPRRRVRAQHGVVGIAGLRIAERPRLHRKPVLNRPEGRRVS